MTMRLNAATEPLMCMAFPTTLKKAARDWFNRLGPGSIDSFTDLDAAFRNQFAASKKRTKNPASLLSVSQRPGEKLRSYIHGFNIERLDVEDCSDDVAIAAFTNGLKEKDLIKSLYKHPPKNYDGVMSRAKTYMVAEEAMQFSSDEEPSKKIQKRGRHDGNSKKNIHARTPPPCRARSPPPRRARSTTPLPPRRFTLLNRARNEVLNHIREAGYVKDPPPMKPRSAASRRKSDAYCRFHRDYGHDTEDCYQLKEEIEELINRGRLQRFVAKDRNSEERRPYRNEATRRDRTPPPSNGEE